MKWVWLVWWVRRVQSFSWGGHSVAGSAYLHMRRALCSGGRWKFWCDTVRWNIFIPRMRGLLAELERAFLKRELVWWKRWGVCWWGLFLIEAGCISRFFIMGRGGASRQVWTDCWGGSIDGFVPAVLLLYKIFWSRISSHYTQKKPSRFRSDFSSSFFHDGYVFCALRAAWFIAVKFAQPTSVTLKYFWDACWRFFFVKYDPDFVCVLSGQRVPTDKHWTMENPSLFIFTAWDRHEFQHKTLIAQNPHVNLLSPQRKASTSETLNCLHPNLHRIHSSNHSIIIAHPAGCSKSKPGIAASFLEITVTVRSPTIPEHWKRHQHRES